MTRFLLVVAFVLLGCGGAPFESSSFTDSPLAGAPSSAGAQAVGSSAGLSGGASAGAGGVASGNNGGNSAGGDGSAGDPPDVLAGAAGDGPSRPCDTSTWTAQAFASRELATSPAAALDGVPGTRWTSGTARAEGQWFALELGAGVVLTELELQAPTEPDDVPSSLELELDGKATPATLEPAGPGVIRLRFAPTPATSARLTLTSSSAAWWSIFELGAVCK